MTVRQADKGREWECQLYVIAKGLDDFMLGHTGVCYREDRLIFHPHRGGFEHRKPGFGGRKIETLNLIHKTGVIVSRSNIVCLQCPEHIPFK